MKKAMGQPGDGQGKEATKAAFYVRYDRMRRTMLEIGEGPGRVREGVMS